jgi:hypothetical protein
LQVPSKMTPLSIDKAGVSMLPFTLAGADTGPRRRDGPNRPARIGAGIARLGLGFVGHGKLLQ